jgi:hypothetical protein
VKELFEATLDLEPLNPAYRSPGLVHSGEVIAVVDAYYAVSERMDIRGFFLAILSWTFTSFHRSPAGYRVRGISAKK